MHHRSMPYVAMLGAALLVAAAAPSRANETFDAIFVNSSPVDVFVASNRADCRFTLPAPTTPSRPTSRECTRIQYAYIQHHALPEYGEVRMRLAGPGAGVPPINPGEFTSEPFNIHLHPQCTNKVMGFYMGGGDVIPRIRKYFQRRVVDEQGKHLGWEITIVQLCSKN